ncbi:hypothetical protein PybrP1_011439 [[Pythium] brassicae (nom. inval.)]|nr:hypothetical protein PybrP1_011439 [[Pythium] brassicae (nom. inval.)]
MTETAISPRYNSVRGTGAFSGPSNRSYSITSSSTNHSVSDATSDSQAADEMTDREKETLTSVAKSMTESLLEATDLLGGIPWCLVHEKHGISLFRADVGNNVPCNVHAVCKVTCEIEDVAESMITSTTESYTRMMELLSSDFIDGAVIQNIVEPTALKPHRYVGLKWAAFKSSSKFTKDRDFTILEYVDMIEDEQGQKIAVRVMESVDVPRVSKYAESAKYTRDVVPLMGFMYHTTKKPGELRMTYTCNFDNGDLPAWAANSAIQSHVEKCINGILKYIETFRAKKETIVLPQQVMSMCEQDHCKVCERNFCVLRRRYNCLKCGEVICSSCSRIRSAVIPEHGERQLRVCTACVLEVRRTSRLATDSPHAGASLDSGAASPARSPGSPSPVVRTQSFSGPAGKRRSCDDLLEPVRSRLMEHKTFSASPDAAAEIPKATFPLRSLSDGFVMRKGNFFTSRRRGSPADLAISLEAFRNHQMRMAGSSSEHEPADDDESLTDTEDSLRQFEYFSSACSGAGSAASSDSGESSPTGSSASQTHTPSSSSSRGRDRRESRRPSLPSLESVLLPLNATQPLIEEGVRPRKQSAFEIKISSDHPFASTASETKAKLDAAIQRSQLIIEDAAYANNLAQHARKLSHHRIVALQREYEQQAINSGTSVK